MNYPHIIEKVYCQPWLIQPAKHEAIRKILESHLAQAMPEAVNTAAPSIDERGSIYDVGPIRIIPLSGIIGKHLSLLEMMCGGASIDLFQAQIKEAAENSNIETVILDINSPGGTVTGIPEAGALVADLAAQKNVVAFTDCMAASAAYWIASQARSIYTTPSAQIGSIGVYAVFTDQTGAIEQAGIKVNAISSGKYKLTGAPFKAMTEDEREMLQTDVDRIAAHFRSAVLSNREIDPQHMEGQIYDGETAAANGLADGLVADLDEVIGMLT